ncbi:MAG: hypothetical protein Q8K78_09730 [Planctomycetaceae bacterium]|nr:hypothetical protein [Planctomycetaceae bacterium]
MNKHQTSVAAEGFAAGVFAHAGYSVFVQYGANQPGYDILVSDDSGCTMRVNVKGSSNGGWMLTSKGKNESHEDARLWWHNRNKSLVFCLVQFQRVEIGQLPRMYLASGDEIATEMMTHWFGNEISLSLWESYSATRGKYKGKHTKLPDSWTMDRDRIEAVMAMTASVIPK